MASDPTTGEFDSASGRDVLLSLVIPCYNEEARLPRTLDIVLEFLEKRDYTWELILADDGSDDDTPLLARTAADAHAHVRHLRLWHRGKAGAIRSGVSAARGRLIVFTDADLSTPVEYVDEAVRLLSGGWDLVIGTREGKGARRINEPFYRHLMGRLFNYLVQLITVRGIRDTQCGFKGFRADIAHDLFNRALLYRDEASEVSGPLVTGFDVELLFLSRKYRYRLFQLPLTWRHVDGSKVRPGIDSLMMVRDLLRVRLNELRHRYDHDPAGEMVSRFRSTEP